MSIDVFIPKQHDERYQFSPEFADGLERELALRASKDFKIDLTFLQGIRNIILDFDERFPLCTPLTFREYDSKEEYFKRPDPAAASETTTGTGLFQIQRDGQTYFLSVYDLKILKSVQSKVSKYISMIFDETRAKLKANEATANKRYIEANTDIWTSVHLSDETLQEIDPYGFYTAAEKKRFNIPDQGKIFTEQEDDHHGND